MLCAREKCIFCATLLRNERRHEIRIPREAGRSIARNWCAAGNRSLQNGAIAASKSLVGDLSAHYSAFRTLLRSEEPASMEPNFINELAKRLAGSIPEGLANLRADLEENFRAVLQSGLAKLDLVTRQEFDVQAGVLKRTREKLEALETRLAELEAAAKQPH
jgi:ubiquinone biosynthesis accessory factor UbiK